MLAVVGEIAGLDVVDVIAHGIFYLSGQVGIAAEEFRREALIDSEHVLHHKHLSVRSGAGAYADCRYLERRRDFGGERSWDFLHNQSEAAGFLKHQGVVFQFLGLGVGFGPHVVGAEFVDALWRET